MRRHCIERWVAFVCHAAFATMALATEPPPPASRAPIKMPTDYRLVWSDEFNSDGLPDPAKWAYDTERNKAGWYNEELQYYAGPRKENAFGQAGRLTIHARRESLSTRPDWGGQRYTASRLITRGKQDWTYGFFEIRAKLPCGKGTWPAIWMLNTPGVWPAGGELDIMEHVGREPGRVFSTVHTAAGHGGKGTGDAVKVADACRAFHTYQMHWTADRIRFGVDGLTHFEYKNPRTTVAQWPFDTPQFLILNIAVGGQFGGAVDDQVFPVALEIDYVRVYQRVTKPQR